MPDVCRVVALGGGYASSYLHKALRPKIRGGQVQLTVIDRNNYHVFHGLVAEMLMGKVQLSNIISPARTLFRNAEFHNAEIESVDFERKEITTTRFLDGKKFTVPYDQLMIGMGSIDDLSRYHGLAENTFLLKSYWDAFELKNHIINVFEMAEIEADAEEKQRLLTFVVAGANYAGIEICTELDEFVETLTRRYYRNIAYEEVRIVVINSGDGILPELGERFPRLSAYARRFLDNSRIQIRYQTRLESATPYEAITSAGEVISTRTIVSCTGNALPAMFDDWNLPRDERGRIITDEYGRVSKELSVWAAGDCTSFPFPKGGRCPPLAIFAMTQGKCIGKNISRMIDNKSLKAYTFTGLGDACCLGRHTAVGQLYGIQVTGLFAWLTWRLFMLIYLPVMSRRVRTLVDWMIWPFLGREIVSIRSNDPVSVKNVCFDAGQFILRQGDEGNGMYIISEGEVEVLKKTENGDERVALLGEGQYFGDIAIFEDCQRTASVRATSRVKLLELKRGTAMLMKKSFSNREASNNSS